MRLKILLPIALVLIAGTVYLMAGKTSAASGPETDKPLALDAATAKAASGDLVKTLRLSGQTSARDFRNMSAPSLKGPESSHGLILLKLPKAGSTVKKGEVIVQIEAQQTKDHVDDVADFVRQADADMRKRKSEQDIEWESLQQTLRQAKSDMEKAQLDAKTTSLLTDIERELLELNAEETAARYKQLQQDLVFHKAAYQAEMHILGLTKERQQRHHDRHARDLETFTVVSPMNGLAVMQQIFRGGDMGQIQEGDMVYPGQLFMKVVNPRSMQMEARANQAESGDLRIGQKVKVRFDAFPGLVLDGHIYSIGALAAAGWSQSVYVRSVPVNILIDGADPRVIPDLSASGDVELERADHAVSIPLSAVRQMNGKASVMVRKGEIFEERAVTLGMRTNEQVAVLTGLRAGEEVRLN